MWRAVVIASAIVCLSCALPPGVGAQPQPAGTVTTADLPGGVEGLRRAVGDQRVTPPATVIVEFTRRFHGGSALSASGDAVLARLRTWLRLCERSANCGAPDLAVDRVPLPGTTAFWSDVVFEKRVPPARVPLAILSQREPALLYVALLSMPEDTRAWLLDRPALVRRLAISDVGALVVAAPYLRIAAGRWQLPAGPAATPFWAAIAGTSPDDADAWLPALLDAHGGLGAYLLEVVDTLSPQQQRGLLALADDEARRVSAATALVDGLRTATHSWSVGDQPFSRPSPDPAFLLAQLRIDPNGRLGLPGDRAFWTHVFESGAQRSNGEAAVVRGADAAPVDAGWLIDRVWRAAPAEQTTRYEQVLWAARWLHDVEPSQAATATVVLRAQARYPQLLRVLDRMGVDDLPRLAALVRRADALTAADGGWRRHAAVVRWQSTVALLDHMVRLGALEGAELTRALDALADAGPDDASDGARVQALLHAIGIDPARGDVQRRPVEDALIARLSRSALAVDHRVTWEGVPYRIDIGASERTRLTRVRGHDAGPRLDAAWAILALADDPVLPRDVATTRAALDALLSAVGLDRPAAAHDMWGREARDAAATAKRLLAGAATSAPRLRAALHDLGDVLATEGLAELAYAVQLGWAENLPLSAMAAFRRHAFSTSSPVGTIDASWLEPVVVTGRRAPWHIVGSLLGLDDALAPMALRRTSVRPIGAAPRLDTGARRWLLSTVAAVDRRRFTDQAQDDLVALATRGQARLRAIHDPDGARAVAAAAGVSPLRQALAGWLAIADPSALAGLFSMTDLLRLGSDGEALPPALVGWGNVERPITGRIGVGSLPTLPWERYAGRSTRLLSCALPDLQLWLGVRLAELDLPALLVPDLLPAASFEFVHLAAPRHVDDFDALVEYARRIERDAVERYLGLLTTAGVLRPEGAPPIEETTTAASGAMPGLGALTVSEPAEGTAVVGSIRIRVATAANVAAPTAITMFVDGLELCRLRQPPWSCSWDAGSETREHHIRVVAALEDGGRLVANRRTRSLDVDERVEVTAVQVPVIVTDANGRFVRGLTRDAFRLIEDGRPQRIDTLIDESLPLQLIAAIDISASMEKAMPRVQTAVKGLLGQLRPGDTTTLLGFNETVFVLAESEGDAVLREAAVEALVPWGGTAFFDATVRSLDMVSQRAGRRGIIMFSDGDDRHSVAGRSESLRRIEEGQVAVYTVGFGEGASEQFRGTLQAFAQASGGRAFFPRKADDLGPAFAAILEELSHQYILSYVSSSPPDGGWRSLEISACEGCRVRAREGYRARRR